ncbi:MAG: outer membrane beta-barrel protein [Chitinophagaceae bacterium]
MPTTTSNNGDKVKIHYLEVPVNFVYKPMLGTGNLLLGFGPYAAFGIGGNVNAREIEFTEKFNTSSAPQFKRFDAGGNLLAGYEFANNLSFQLNTQLGMINIRPENDQNRSDKSKWKNTGFGVSLGYRF